MFSLNYCAFCQKISKFAYTKYSSYNNRKIDSSSQKMKIESLVGLKILSEQSIDFINCNFTLPSGNFAFEAGYDLIFLL